MPRLDVKDALVWITLSYVVVTALNVIISRVFPSIPVVKSGFFLVLLLVAVTMVGIFVIFYDRKIEASEIWMFLVIVGVMVGIYYVTKKFIPELYALIPDSTKEVFSAITP